MKAKYMALVLGLLMNVSWAQAADVIKCSMIPKQVEYANGYLTRSSPKNMKYDLTGMTADIDTKNDVVRVEIGTKSGKIIKTYKIENEKAYATEGNVTYKTWTLPKGAQNIFEMVPVGLGTGRSGINPPLYLLTFYFSTIGDQISAMVPNSIFLVCDPATM